jgi:putative membrane protein
VAWLLHALAVLLWHLPGLYQRAAQSELLHALQHTSFLVTALLFWYSVLPAAALRQLHGAAILSLFGTMVYTGGLGALLTLGRELWYPGYGGAAPLWGLTALEDQQLAGLIMWVPGGVSYLLAAAWLVVDWLRVSELRAVRMERNLPAWR